MADLDEERRERIFGDTRIEGSGGSHKGSSDAGGRVSTNFALGRTQVEPYVQGFAAKSQDGSMKRGTAGVNVRIPFAGGGVARLMSEFLTHAPAINDGTRTAIAYGPRTVGTLATGYQMAKGGIDLLTPTKRPRDDYVMSPEGSYAEGGEVEKSYLPEIAGGLGAGAIATAGAFSPRYARLMNAVRLAMKPISSNIETAVTGRPALGRKASDALYEFSRSNAPAQHLAKQTPTVGRGAWWSDGAATPESNPLYMEDVGRSPLRPLSARTDIQKRAAQIGSDLGQDAVALGRFAPTFRNLSRDANAVLMRNVKQDEVSRLTKELQNPNIVMSHRPDGSLAAFDWTDSPMPVEELMKTIMSKNPASKPRYAVSRPMRDRMLIGREYGDATYADVGATPPSDSMSGVLSDIANGNVSYTHAPFRELP